jgi:hypothetical protein
MANIVLIKKASSLNIVHNIFYIRETEVVIWWTKNEINYILSRAERTLHTILGIIFVVRDQIYDGMQIAKCNDQ